MRAAGIPDVQHFIFDHEAPSPWTGPVIRLGDLTCAERVAIGGSPRAERSRSTHETWLCRGPFCRRFPMYGAYLRGICNWCGTPRPS